MTTHTAGEPLTIAGISPSKMVLEERESYDTAGHDDGLTFTGNCYTLAAPETGGNQE